MLTKLRQTRLINGATGVCLDDWDRIRRDQGVWNTEVEQKVEFLRFLKEIPANFLELATSGEKHELVKKHMLTFYMGTPKDYEVETVIERITNLAQYVKLGRDNVENKTGQGKFKSDNWKTVKRCEICGAEFANYDEVSLDHIIPLSLGGAERKDNWQLTCKLCNQQKMQFWGIADISRVESSRYSQGKFLGLKSNQLITQLATNSNPTRYWIFERDSRRCSIDGCLATAKTEKLYISYKKSNHLPTIDNLASFCIDCLPERSGPRCK
jgi:hypothetical protein